MTTRQRSEAQEALLLDLTNLGLRPRRGHDLRRTFITLAQADGAARNVLEAMTHGPRGDIVDLYTSFPWPVMCREMAKFQPRATGAEASAGTERPDSLQPSSQRTKRLGIAGKKM